MRKNLFGSETKKAIDNFSVSNYSLNTFFIRAFAVVKLSCCQINSELGFLSKNKANAIETACKEIIKGENHDQIIVDPFQGGAGTSTNMNFNEVIANRASEIIIKPNFIDPLRDVNLHQSTNDVYPTALKTAILLLLKELEKKISELQIELQKKELEFKDIIKLGRTQLQDAVPMTLGMTFGAFSEAIARDRWRIFKARERIKVVNLGGTAIGTGLDAPQEYIFKVTERLRNLTGLAISRSENLIDATQNLDPFVEISGMLKACASNILKISSDLRILSSGPIGGINEISLPKMQKGSTIMPGKVNPVIPEMMSQIAIKIISNDNIVALSAGMGNLELNQFIPLLGFSLLESLELLNNSIPIFTEKCIIGIKANIKICKKHVENSKTLATILINKLGYQKVEELLEEAEKNSSSLKKILLKKGIFNKDEITKILSPQNMYKLGF